jgi:hypothetical protein
MSVSTRDLHLLETAYLSLALPCFNQTLDLDFQLSGAETHTTTVSYALTDAPPDSPWLVVVFFNGLGGHRLIAAMIEGISARARRPDPHP